MATTPTWQNVAAGNFGSANDLLAQAGDTVLKGINSLGNDVNDIGQGILKEREAPFRNELNLLKAAKDADGIRSYAMKNADNLQDPEEWLFAANAIDDASLKEEERLVDRGDTLESRELAKTKTAAEYEETLKQQARTEKTYQRTLETKLQTEQNTEDAATLKSVEQQEAAKETGIQRRENLAKVYGSDDNLKLNSVFDSQNTEYENSIEAVQSALTPEERNVLNYEKTGTEAAFDHFNENTEGFANTEEVRNDFNSFAQGIELKLPGPDGKLRKVGFDDIPGQIISQALKGITIDRAFIESMTDDKLKSSTLARLRKVIEGKAKVYYNTLNKHKDVGAKTRAIRSKQKAGNVEYNRQRAAIHEANLKKAERALSN